MRAKQQSTTPLTVLQTDRTQSLGHCIDEYLDDVRARTRAATYANYRSGLLSSFLPWCEHEGITELEDVTQAVVNRWVVWLREKYRTERGKPLAGATQRTYVTAVGFWLNWLRRRGDVEEVRAQAPKKRPRVLDVLSREEIRQLEAGATTERDKLLIRVLADTGARLSEALELREQDVVEPVRRQYAVKLGGKTGERLVPITPGLARRLRSYVQHGRPKDYYGSHIFVGLHKVGDGRYQAPGRTTISRMIREAAERAGIKKRVYAHLLRHSAITHLLRQGTNPLIVAQVAGHSSLETIRSTYAHLTLSDAQEAVMGALLNDDED